jgi:hypothetical protein
MAQKNSWSDVQFQDRGLATQMAFRTAQQGVNNIVDIADGYQDSRDVIDKANFTQQGKLNTQEQVNRIRNFDDATGFSQAQDGALSEQSTFDNIGININQATVQAAKDKKQVALAQQELINLSKLDETKANLMEQGVGGANSNKARLMALANNPTQLAAMETMIDAQTSTVLTKQNNTKIADAVKLFKGLDSDGKGQHNNAVQYLENRAEAEGYTVAQKTALIKEYEAAEKGAANLSGVQTTQLADMNQVQTSNMENVTAYTAGQLALLQDQYTKGAALFNTVDTTNLNTTNEEIVASLKNGNTLAQYSQIRGRLNELTGKFSAGRKQAMFSNLVKGGINPDDDGPWEEMIKAEIANNEEGYANFQADYKTTVDNYNGLTANLAEVTKENTTFGIRARKAAQADELAPATPKMAAFLEAIRVKAAAAGETVQKAANGQPINPTAETAQTTLNQEVEANQAAEQQVLDDTYSTTEQNQLNSKASSLLRDTSWGPIIQEEGNPDNLYGSNFQAGGQAQELAAAGKTNKLWMPLPNMNVGDYVKNNKAYITAYNKIPNRKHDTPSTAGGPFQLTTPNIATAVDRGFICSDA